MTSDLPATSTAETGTPAPSDADAGADGPLLLHDHHFIAQMAHFNRERVPERNVPAKGGGAFGWFEVTDDVSAYTKASLFQPGTRTGALLRFSTVAGEQGSADTVRDPRGFAVKFYTCEGNYDLVGNNTPVFFIRDPMKFPHFIRSQQRQPDSGLRDNDMQWDFWTLNPESAHQVTWLFGDRGTPRTWRHMNGYGSHTYLWVNAAGERHWVKYHFRTDQGVETFTADEAAIMVYEDPDYHRRDLFGSIARGDHPTWTLYVQLMPYADAPGYRFNPFDVTKVWPHADYPLQRVGRLVLDRNPENLFAQIEQAAFEPSALVPGIWVSPDKMLLGRMFAHSPHSYGGPAVAKGADDHGWGVAAAEMVRAAARPHADDDDFGQAGTLVREVLDDAARDRLVGNVAGALNAGVTPEVVRRAVAYWRSIDKTVGDQIAATVAI
ncbi:MAG: catalase [Micromonosporaceae bacterium]